MEKNRQFTSPIYDFLLFKKTNNISYLKILIKKVKKESIIQNDFHLQPISVTWLKRQLSSIPSYKVSHEEECYIKTENSFKYFKNCDYKDKESRKYHLANLVCNIKYFNNTKSIEKYICSNYELTKKSTTRHNFYSGICLKNRNELLLELELLINIYKKGIAKDLILDVLHNEIKFIISTRRDTDFSKGQYAIFPDFVTSDGSGYSYSNDLSWAGGIDLPIALLLYQAEQLFADSELGRIADLVGLNTTLRTDEQNTSLKDAYFKEGTAGVAYLNYKIYLLTRNKAYERGFRFWQSKLQEQLAQEEMSAFALQQHDKLPTEFWEAKALLQLFPQQNEDVFDGYIDISSVEL